MRTYSMLFPTAAAAFLVVGCRSSPPAARDEQTSQSAANLNLAFPTEHIATLWVKGLACPYCVHNVDRQLAEVSGVEQVHVDLPTGKVRVALTSENPATREQLMKAIDDSGFTLDRIEMPQ